MKTTMSAALLGAGLLLAPAASAAVRVDTGLAAESAQSAAFSPAEIDRLRVSCRRKVRRWLGPVKGRHTGTMRIAYTEQCAMNGGRLV